MKILITKHKDDFRADCLDIPGSPPVGTGITKEHAVANLCIMLSTADYYRCYMKGRVEFKYE